jgi:hypothetical protein
MMSFCRDAQFYDVSDNIKLTGGLILKELNVAIIDTMDDTLTYRLDDHATNLPIQILSKLTAHNVKYKQLLQGNNVNKVFRDLFIVDEGYLPDIVALYTRLGIY